MLIGERIDRAAPRVDHHERSPGRGTELAKTVPMGILDSILGTDKPRREPQSMRPRGPQQGRSEDAVAVERYRYMLKTAPPETLEQAHAEAFARLTPEQRRMALTTLANATPPGERASAQQISPDDPQAMGRLATRAEMRQPGFMERTFGGGGGGGGFGGSLLGSFAMGFVGSMVAQSFLSSMGGWGDAHAATPDAAPEGGSDGSDGSGFGGGPEGDGAVEGDFDAGDFDGGDFGDF